MALTTAKHICRMPCCVLLLLYCTMDPKIYLKLHFEFFKTVYCPGDFCTNLFVGMQEGPSGPKPQIKQTNKQPTFYWKFLDFSLCLRWKV